MRFERAAWATALLVLVGAAYANHFHNAFHFDDFHTIEQNLYIRSLANIPRFFTDSTTFSNLPTHQVYRPLLTTTLAIDWALGGGKPIAFHVSTFGFYLIFLAAIFSFFLQLLDNDLRWAFAATALFALHPVCAETVNYIVQRAEILSTLGVVASLSLYLAKPAWRRFGLYLVPLFLALLVKPPALVAPILLFGALYCTAVPARRAVREAVPALIVCAGTAILLSRMSAPTFAPGGGSPYLYRLTEAGVILHYFTSFFAPLHLSADSDWHLVTGIGDPIALAGLAFLAVTIAAIVWLFRRPDTRAIAYGLFWFLIALFPTSWMPLAEPENDHRMFFPFVGLALAAAATLKWICDRWRVSLPWLPRAVAGALVLTSLVEAKATVARNEVWRTEESLWRDVTIESPLNGRGHMNYGLALMARGDYVSALRSFERAHVLLPAYFILEINMGIGKGALGRDAEAERHFIRALELEPLRYESHYFYARYLLGKGRLPDALLHAKLALQSNTNALDARHLLMQLYTATVDWQQLDALVRDTVAIVPADPVTLGYQRSVAAHLTAPAPAPSTPEDWLAQSLTFYNLGRFDDCIRAAREALKLRPNYAEAYNNMAAAYNSMHRWDEGIHAADEALRINPQFQIARNNRQWAVSQKQAGVR